MSTSGFADEQHNLPGRLPNHGTRATAGARVVSALLATGAFAVLAGGILLLPFALSPYATQNDVYLGNYFLAPVFLVVGAGCFVGGLFGLVRSSGLQGQRGGLLVRALLLALLGGASVALATFLVGGRYTSVGPNAPNWPPYLNTPLLAVAIVLGILVCVVAAIWNGLASTRTERAPTNGAGQEMR